MRRHGPLGRIGASLARHLGVDCPLLAQKAEHRVERREPDGAVAQPLGR